VVGDFKSVAHREGVPPPSEVRDGPHTPLVCQGPAEGVRNLTIELGSGFGVCCRAIMARMRQSRPDSGLGLKNEVFKTFSVVPISLGSGRVSPRTTLLLLLYSSHV